MIGCVKCNEVMLYLRARQIPFKEINVMEEPEAVRDVMDRTGEFVLPIIVYRNHTFKPAFDASGSPMIDLEVIFNRNKKSR
jgi:Arsenate reductase and related proteins, glutaredoxin family